MRKVVFVLGAILNLTLLLAKTGSTGELQIVKIWPEKLLYAPGEEVRGTVTVANTSNKNLSGRLWVKAVTDFDQATTLFDADISLPAGVKTEFPVSYVPQGSQLGYELETELFRGQFLLDKKREFFVVSEDPWRVAHYHSNLWSYGLDVAAQVAKWRYDYSCMAEWFGVGQAYVGEYAPKQEEWISNIGGREKKSTIQALTRTAHTQGIKVTAYWWGQDFGPMGYEFARTHPDWVAYDSKGRWKAAFDTALTDKIADDAFRYRMRNEYDAPGSDKAPMWFPISYNWRVPELVDYHAQQLITAIQMFGWDGIRYDFWLVPGSVEYDSQGRPMREGTADEIGARNHKSVMEEVRKSIPKALFGYNYGVRYSAFAALTPKTFQAMCPGNYMLFEEAVALWNPGEYLNNWEVFRDVIKKESYYPINAGGYFFVHLCRAGVIQSPLSYEYEAAIIFASRGHLGAVSEVAASASEGEQELNQQPLYPHVSKAATNLPGGLRRINAFALRYADNLFAKGLNDLKDGVKKIAVSNSALWWKDYIYTRPTDRGEEWIVHMINPPVSNVPDPAMKTGPAPVKDTTVTIVAPEGLKTSRVWWLSPDGTEWGVPLKADTEKNGYLKVTVPEIQVWGLLCVDWEAK